MTSWSSADPADPIQFTSLEGSEQTGVSVVFKFNQP